MNIAEAACDEAPPPPPTTSSCDHIAIVPAIPPGVRADDGDSRAHWLRIMNPSPEETTFAITGHDSTGEKYGTFGRTIPANGVMKVRVRDIEAAFDGDGTGWWSMLVTASGPVHVVATMHHSEGGRVVLPVERPSECPAGR